MITTELLKEIEARRQRVCIAYPGMIKSVDDAVVAMLTEDAKGQAVTWDMINEDAQIDFLDWIADVIDEESATLLVQYFQMRGFNIALFEPGMLMSWSEWKNR